MLYTSTAQVLYLKDFCILNGKSLDTSLYLSFLGRFHLWLRTIYVHLGIEVITFEKHLRVDAEPNACSLPPSTCC